MNIIDERLVSALDKCKLSDPNAVHIIIAVAKALGHCIENIKISRTTIMRFRKTLREEIASKIKADFHAQVIINS